LLRASWSAQCSLSASAESAAHPDGAAESKQSQTLDQILFDLTRMRLTLQHLLDSQLGSEVTDQIRRTAQAEAERYIQRLDGRRWS
jgi:hypothetical protein